MKYGAVGSSICVRDAPCGTSHLRDGDTRPPLTILVVSPDLDRYFFFPQSDCAASAIIASFSSSVMNPAAAKSFEFSATQEAYAPWLLHLLSHGHN